MHSMRSEDTKKNIKIGFFFISKKDFFQGYFFSFLRHSFVGIGISIIRRKKYDK